MTLEKALQSTPTSFTSVVTDVPIEGWSGWNVINISPLTTYGNTAGTQYGRLRFTFKANGGNTSYIGLNIMKIQGYGGMGWTTPSNMAKTGHLYSYDADQNATFPAQITATQFNGNATTATSSTRLNANTEITYGWNGINYFNISTTNQSAAKVNDTPFASSVWTHILRFNHANNTGYYTDLAIPFSANSIYYKRINEGALQNSSINGGWVKVLDQLNYTDYTVTKTGSGASGTWGISISGNAATASSVAWNNITDKPINLKAYSGSLASGGWAQLNGKANSPSIAIAYNSNPAAWNSYPYSSSMVFGCSDTRGLLDIAYNTPTITFGGTSFSNATDDNPKWYFKINGTSGQSYTFPSTSKTLAATDGTGASGTWGISISGTAAKATADKNGNDITTKYVTVDTAQDNISGRKTFSDLAAVTFKPSSGTDKCNINYDATLGALVFSF